MCTPRMKLALTYQNLLFCRVPINSILRFIIRTCKKVGFGRLRYYTASQKSKAISVQMGTRALPALLGSGLVLVAGNLGVPYFGVLILLLRVLQ